MSGLYPTKTRLALLHDTATPMHVWIDTLTGDSYIGEDGPKVTSRIHELESAGLIDVRDGWWWALTPSGEEWLARVEQESS